MFGKLANVTVIIACLMVVVLSCTPKPPPDQVVVQLNWQHDAEFAGFYVALSKGFFAEENLAVTLREGGAGINARKLLLSGDADFAVLGFGEHRRNIEKGDPAVAVMAAYQLSPLVLIVHPDSGIASPRDLVGRRVGIKDENWLKVIEETLRNVGLDPGSFVRVDVGYDEVARFYSRDVEVWTGFAHDEPNTIRMAGYEVNLIFPAEYGVGGYEGLLVVRRETMDAKPDMVARMVRALAAGWRYAARKPDEAAAIMAAWQPDRSPEFLSLAARSVAPLVVTGRVPIGWIDETTWKSLLGAAYSPDAPGFTLRFVEPDR